MKLNSVLHVAACGLLAFASLGFSGASQSKKAKVPYSKVEPIFKAKCISCHNPDRHPEGVDLTSYKSVIASGEKAKIVVAGHPEKSSLIQYVDGTKKPLMPIGSKPLTKDQITLLKNWIASGAKN